MVLLLLQLLLQAWQWSCAQCNIDQNKVGSSWAAKYTWQGIPFERGEGAAEAAVQPPSGRPLHLRGRPPLQSLPLLHLT